MKSYTDLKQSEKLAEILPFESADMFYVYDRHLDKLYGDTPYVINYKALNKDVAIPCWSLSALLGIIPKRIKEYNVLRIDIDEKYFSIWYDEVGCGVNNKLPDITMECTVDACVEMILKLKEKNLL